MRVWLDAFGSLLDVLKSGWHASPLRNRLDYKIDPIPHTGNNQRKDNAPNPGEAADHFYCCPVVGKENKGCHDDHEDRKGIRQDENML